MKNIFNNDAVTNMLLGLAQCVYFVTDNVGDTTVTFTLPVPFRKHNEEASPVLKVHALLSISLSLPEAMADAAQKAVMTLDTLCSTMYTAGELPQASYDKLMETFGDYWAHHAEQPEEQAQEIQDSLQEDEKPDTNAKHEAWKQRDLDDISTEGAEGSSDAEEEPKAGEEE